MTAPSVRPLQTLEEYRAAQELQRRTWGITGEGYLMPVSLMVSIQHAGGLVLGAFDDGRLVGFSMAYLGRVRGELALYSQLTAVDPGEQARGVGGRLKEGQREWARAQGLKLMAWTFDPLQAGNANFNVHRLGATSRTYLVNHYGERLDALNTGLPTDRLLVEWRVDDVARRWLGDGQLTPLVDDHDGRPRIHDVTLTADLTLRVCIPRDIAKLKDTDLALAQAWQDALRTTLPRAFSAGYLVMDFRRSEVTAHYLLRKPEEER
ncbi:MAG: GNAT family N-acetyltransferase [Myxococcota bacterium]